MENDALVYKTAETQETQVLEFPQSTLKKVDDFN
jgi:hypothetical protein